jgi:hypothetical protein
MINIKIFGEHQVPDHFGKTGGIPLIKKCVLKVESHPALV